MHSILEHTNPPYIEVVVYGRYAENYSNDLQSVINRYAAQFDKFSMLELQHGNISNGLWRFLQSSATLKTETVESFKKLKRIAIVSDEPGMLIKLVTLLPRSGTAEFKIFKLHELDMARTWMRL